MSNPKLKVGKKAPAITTTDQHGNKVKLADYKGKKVLLFFYPKDNTPGCTSEAVSLMSHSDEIQKKGYHIMGISPQGESSHLKFATKYQLEYPLLVDEDHSIAEKYGVWVEKNMYGRKYMGVHRSTYLIDESGTILDIIWKVKTKEAGPQALEHIEKIENA